MSGVVLGAREKHLGRGTLTPEERVALVLSVKESAFKCLYPLLDRRRNASTAWMNQSDASSTASCSLRRRIASQW